MLIGHRAGPDTMEKHVLFTLRAMGYEVEHFNIKDAYPLGHKIDRYAQVILRGVLREPERLGEKKLVRRIDDYRPDLILVLLGSTLSPKTVSRIRKIHKGPVVCWCQDQMTTMGRQYLIGAGYDAIFVKDHYMVRFLRDFVGHPAVYYLPEACNPQLHKSVALSHADRSTFASDICMFGTLYYYRQAILEHLYRYDLKVWGDVPDWLINRIGTKHTGALVYEEDKCKAVAGTKIVLNTLHYGEIEGLNCRAFEVAGCGGFQLVSWTPAVEEHFKVGEEIEVYHDRNELTEKVEFYLEQPERRHEIALAGQRRAYAEHTYRHRLARLVDLSGG
jgi:spore maturation protein CgeB